MGFKPNKADSSKLNRRLRRPTFEKESKQKKSGVDLPEGSPNFFSKNLIQPKLKMGEPGDAFEKEADAVADQVVERADNTGGSLNSAQQVQRQEKSASAEAMKGGETTAEKEEEKTQAKPELQPQEEKEEDKVQAKTELQLQESEPASAKATADKEEEKAQTKPDPALQAKPEAARDDKKGPGNKAPSVEQLLQQSKGKGFPLPDDIRGEMEKELGADFSQVRIHTGAEAEALARRLKAQAFTYGYDIYFNKGKYQPETKAGKHLLAHELTHVVQQKGK